MADTTRHLLICSCDDTMPLDAGAVRRGCRCEATTATQLCGAELDRFRTIAAEDTPLTVACTQEAARFSEVALEIGRAGPIQFANIRESAGWSSEADQAQHTLLAADIKRFLDRPAEPLQPIAAADAPPGAPIGGDADRGWLDTPPY